MGLSIAKSELYGWLRLPIPGEGEEYPPGFCHFPEYGEEYFKELTAEHLVTVTKPSGRTALEWQMIPNRENHFLDARNYARAAASVKGLDRVIPQSFAKPAQPTQRSTPAKKTTPTAPQQPARSKGSWIRGKRKGSWLGRRR